MLKKVWSCFYSLVLSLFYKLPGVPAFYASSMESFKKTFYQFLSTLSFSLLPLLTIYGVEVLRSDPTSFSGVSTLQYINAGQIFFYVGPIIGGVFYLLVVDLIKGTNEPSGKSEVPERFWFLAYLVVCLVASVVILVLYHTNVISNGKLVIALSAFIYCISLYFSFVDTLYNNLSNNYGAITRENQDAIVNDLTGFDGES